MNVQEAAQVLARAAAFDNRQPSLAMAEAWAAALDPSMTVSEAVALVVAHYAKSREWLMPSDLNRVHSEVRRARVRDFKARCPEELTPQGLEDYPELELAWRKALLEAVASGFTPVEARAHAWQQVKDRRLPGNGNPPPYS